MNEINFSAEELRMMKDALTFNFSGECRMATKIIRKIDILLKEPEDEGGYVGIEIGG